MGLDLDVAARSTCIDDTTACEEERTVGSARFRLVVPSKESAGRLDVRMVRVGRRVDSLRQAPQPVFLLERGVGGQQEAAVVLSVALVELNGQWEHMLGFVLYLLFIGDFLEDLIRLVHPVSVHDRGVDAPVLVHVTARRHRRLLWLRGSVGRARRHGDPFFSCSGSGQVLNRRGTDLPQHVGRFVVDPNFFKTRDPHEPLLL
mmetsp:Transcript_14010/g.32642  ORF Transcript_14010/g.32642 Transcript_14010/m.32642 type:complete len:203 (+) Transcript_14010:436-1044(+)